MPLWLTSTVMMLAGLQPPAAPTPAATVLAEAPDLPPGKIVSDQVAVSPPSVEPVASDTPVVGPWVSRRAAYQAANGNCATGACAPAPVHAPVAAAPCGPQGCGSWARGSCVERLKDWLHYRSHRPGECNLVPTGYQPPLYTFFPCKGNNHGPWIAPCADGHYGIVPNALHNPPLVPTPKALPGFNISKPAPAVHAEPVPPQTSLLPGSAAASASYRPVTAAKTGADKSPYGSAAARPPVKQAAGQVSVYVPSAHAPVMPMVPKDRVPDFDR